MPLVAKVDGARLYFRWLGLSVSLLVPFISYLCMQVLYGSEQTRTRVEWGLVIHWLNLAALVFVVILMEKRPLRSIGLQRFRWWTLPLGAIAGIAIFASSPLIAKLNTVLGLTGDQGLYPFLLSLPVWLRALLVLTAGIFEEVLFRGYAIERLLEMTGSKWIAGFVTVTAFTLAHIPAVGFPHLLPVLIVSILVTLLYLWKRDLMVNVIAHIVIDGIPLLILPVLIQQGVQ